MRGANESGADDACLDFAHFYLSIVCCPLSVAINRIQLTTNYGQRTGDIQSTFSTFAHFPSLIDCSTASSTATHWAPSRKSAMMVFLPLIAPISSYTACTNVCS